MNLRERVASPVQADLPLHGAHSSRRAAGTGTPGPGPTPETALATAHRAVAS